MRVRCSDAELKLAPRAARDGGASISGVPEPVAGAITRELEGLEEGARQLLRGAAVVGVAFDPDLAARAAGMDTSDGLAALDEVLERDLVRSGEVPREFSFRHPIVRRAVYESSPLGWRLAAHARVAEALDERKAPAVARAPHVEASAQPGDEAAIAALSEAAAAAAPRAPAAAAHWYEAAMRLLPGDDAGRRLGMLVPLAQALGAAGRFEESRARLEEVLLLLPADQIAVRAQVVAGCARIDQILGRHGEARDVLGAMLEALPAEPTRESTNLRIQLASEAFFAGDFDALRRWLAEALEDAAARDDSAALAAATGLLGCADYMVDDVAGARDNLDESAKQFGRLSDEEMSRRLHTLSWCGMTEVYLERFDRALGLFERGLSVALATGHGHIPTLMRIGQALALLWRGQLDEAGERLELAIDAARLTGNRQFLCWALWASCWRATLRGDLADAIRIGESAVEAGRGLSDPLSVLAGAYLAEARLEAGEPARARDELLVAIGARTSRRWSGRSRPTGTRSSPEPISPRGAWTRPPIGRIAPSLRPRGWRSPGATPRRRARAPRCCWHATNLPTPLRPRSKPSSTPGARGCRSRSAGLERSPGARSPPPAMPSARSSSWSAPARSSTRAARRATATRPRATCAGWVRRSGAEPSRASPATGSRRSAAASARSPTSPARG